ncbi:266_t:CDS:2, partial [Paraglomus brasilianum]
KTKMVRKILAALILLAMLSTLNAMPRPIIGIIGQQHLTWKKCRDSIPLLTVQADMPIPGQNETVTISGEVPDESAQYQWSFSYIDLEGKPITLSYKGASGSERS